ncbi:RdRp [Wuhan insect virus 22]|uniref:RdRp n=1 Tax=Wuhan insect virus 22 TaxID=1923726 RepID=UPI00090C4973|nr:RdRp [Wuhan insect virus 22]APG78160.1 RdRp [Wuhan insect virus 22]APG78286.1 RdRp [Wuhan insect virus 22]APG78336.1 RdRp [Wuhan insect virus 22]
MAVRIEVEQRQDWVLPSHAPYTISSFEYPERPTIQESKIKIEDGELLPNGKGFPWRMEPPSVSFKVYRAMVNHGLSDVANHVLRTKKRSYITPQAIWNGVLEFGEALPSKLRKLPEYLLALDELRIEIDTKDRITPFTMEEGAKTLPQGTSPGLPYINTHPGWKKGDISLKYMPAFNNYWDRVGQGLPVAPLPDCAAFARSHISSPDVNKVRPVWAYPMMAIAQESRFVAPLLRDLIDQKIGLHTAYGMEMMKGGMTWLNGQAMIANARQPGVKYLMTDFSGFDKSLPAWLIRDIFKIIEEKYQFNRSWNGKEEIPQYGAVERRKFRRLVNYFINTPIQNCDGRRFLKKHGVPSGSMFTNIIDTFANFVMSRTIAKLSSNENPIFDVYFGDDAIMCFSGDTAVDVRKYSLAAKDLFGMTLSPKKSYLTTRPDNIHFLGYFNYHGSPYKAAEELIASMLYPQYLKDDWAYCVSRALGCALASAGMQTDVYLAAQAVFIFASRRENKFEEGLELLRTNPRAKRHMSQMGCSDLPLNESYFRDINALVPRMDCSKITKGVNIVI